MTIMNALQCGSHISALWGSASVYVEYCIYAFPFLRGFAISNFLLDLLIILLPLPQVNFVLRYRCSLLTKNSDLVFAYKSRPQICGDRSVRTGYDVHLLQPVNLSVF